MTLADGLAAKPANILSRIEGDGFSARVFLSPLNQRIQVLDYEALDTRVLVASLDAGAREAGFSKVFLKAPIRDQQRFEEAGMQAEATIAGYFGGKPAVVMSLFLDQERRHRPYAEEEEAILSAIRSRNATASAATLPDGHVMSRAIPSDSDVLAELYQQVFASYPFPITDPEYLVSTMQTNVVYRIIRNPAGDVVAAASAEIDLEHHNAEMTDFATLPETRGMGLALHLLSALEGDMAERQIPNLYTIARARSAGMNRVFFNGGYDWNGTLVNNCHIAGQFEDMHVWSKTISASPNPNAESASMIR